MASSLPFDEKNSATAFSPGLVDSEEFLIREVCDPDHVDEEGSLVEAAISIKDLREQGFSVHRLQYTTVAFIKQAIQQRCAKPRQNGPWKEWAAVLKVADVRSIRHENEQALVVIDTARADHAGHASIYAAAPEKGKSHTRKMRKLLLPFLRLCLSVDEAFQ